MREQDSESTVPPPRTLDDESERRAAEEALARAAHARAEGAQPTDQPRAPSTLEKVGHMLNEGLPLITGIAVGAIAATSIVATAGIATPIVVGLLAGGAAAGIHYGARKAYREHAAGNEETRSGLDTGLKVIGGIAAVVGVALFPPLIIPMAAVGVAYGAYKLATAGNPNDHGEAPPIAGGGDNSGHSRSSNGRGQDDFSREAERREAHYQETHVRPDPTPTHHHHDRDHGGPGL